MFPMPSRTGHLMRLMLFFTCEEPTYETNATNTNSQPHRFSSFSNPRPRLADWWSVWHADWSDLVENLPTEDFAIFKSPLPSFTPVHTTSGCVCVCRQKKTPKYLLDEEFDSETLSSNIAPRQVADAILEAVISSLILMIYFRLCFSARSKGSSPQFQLIT